MSELRVAWKDWDAMRERAERAEAERDHWKEEADTDNALRVENAALRALLAEIEDHPGMHSLGLDIRNKVNAALREGGK